jgi:hypothetical protein
MRACAYTAQQRRESAHANSPAAGLRISRSRTDLLVGDLAVPTA